MICVGLLIEGGAVSDPDTENSLYQTMVGPRYYLIRKGQRDTCSLRGRHVGFLVAISITIEGEKSRGGAVGNGKSGS